MLPLPAPAQIKIGVIGEIDRCIFVGGPLVQNLQAVIGLKLIGDLDVYIAGEAFFHIGAVQFECDSRRMLVNVAQLPDFFVEGFFAAMQSIWVRCWRPACIFCRPIQKLASAIRLATRPTVAPK